MRRYSRNGPLYNRLYCRLHIELHRQCFRILPSMRYAVNVRQAELQVFLARIVRKFPKQWFYCCAQNAKILENMTFLILTENSCTGFLMVAVR